MIMCFTQRERCLRSVTNVSLEFAAEELINLFSGMMYFCGATRKNIHLDGVTGKRLVLLQLP